MLRCIAVVLVIFRHSGARNFAQSWGWIGVDLFFVLSGFLVSGLLFVEYKERGSIDVKRFYVRRALKLYPSFYLLMAVAIVVSWRLGRLKAGRAYLGELLYFQNYGPYVWPHTWSLAVEEHFYLILPLLLLGLIAFARDKHNPFRILPWICLGFAIVCLASRVWMVFGIPQVSLHDWNWYRPAYVDTHTRADSLFCGVFLGYLYHLHGRWEDWVRRRWPFLLALASVFLCFGLVRLDSRFTLTIGFSLLYVGFGLVLVLALGLTNVLPVSTRPFAGRFGGMFAYVGKYSYSIYLWHLPLRMYLPVVILSLFHIRMTPTKIDILCLPLSIAAGILMSLLIEYPTLRLRDRWFPSRHSMPADADRRHGLIAAGTPPISSLADGSLQHG